jgi:hypothetical protein
MEKLRIVGYVREALDKQPGPNGKKDWSLKEGFLASA